MDLQLEEDAGEPPELVHHNWFGPPLSDADRRCLESNLKQLVGGWRTIVWTSGRFSDPGAYELNRQFLGGLAAEYALEERDVEELVGGADLEMLSQCWEASQAIRRLRDVEQPALYAGKVTLIAAMSDFCRMLALHAFGGLWADIGDTSFPKGFAESWRAEGLAAHKFGFRVAMNHSGIVRSPSQHLLSAVAGSRVVGAFIDRMRGLWAERISLIDMTDPSFDAIGTTLAWTGMGGTTGPVMKAIKVCHGGQEMSMMDAWKAGCCFLRFGVRMPGTDECDIGPRAEDLIFTWSNKSWLVY